MSREPNASALRDLRALFGEGAGAALTDEQLLRRYLDRRGEAEDAFSALVDRHGPMVWGVCRRALGRPHEAEDAFQATFLVLARRADSVRVDGSLGRWLYGVACRVAARARADAHRRRAREGPAPADEPAVSPPDPERLEMLSALDEELARLPEKYRSPMVLCHLEGLSYAVAADRLGCPPGAVKGRLARGRELLRSRLSRRGLALPAVAEGASAIPDPRPTVPPMLARSIAHASSSATLAGASAFPLAKGVLRTMTLTRWTKILALLAPASALLGLQVESPNLAPIAAIVPTTEAKVPDDKPDPASTAIVVPLPPRDELRKLLRRAAKESIALASKEPQPAAWGLSTIATAQALAGDLLASKETFAFAAREAGGELGGLPQPWSLWRVGHFQAEAGFRIEALATLRKAVEATTGPAQEFDQGIQTLRSLSEITQEQARLGDRAEARRTADRLEAVAADLLAGSNTPNAEEFLASEVAEALAVVGDLEGTFRRAGALYTADSVIGKAALSAAKSLDRDHARRFVDEAVARMAAIMSAERRYSGLSDLAEARALVGDFEGAKASARSIGEGPSTVDYDMTDGQPYAMTRIAGVQRKAGQIEAARVTLLEAHRMVIDHPMMRFRGDRLLQIAGSQVVANDLDGALRSADAIPEWQRAETLAAIARALSIAGRPEEARKAIDRALAGARATVKTPPPAPHPPAPAPVHPAHAAAPMGPDASSTMLLAKIQAMAGDLAEALKTRASIVDENYRRLALAQVVAALAAAGDVKGALDLATRDARSPGERRSALQAVGQGVEDRLRMESP